MQALQSRMSTVRVNALFKKGGSTARKVSGTERTGGVGYRRYTGDALWLPNTTRPGALGETPASNPKRPAGLIIAQLPPQRTACVRDAMHCQLAAGVGPSGRDARCTRPNPEKQFPASVPGLAAPSAEQPITG
jgi:hypothetical protein